MYTNSIFEESWWLDAVASGRWQELKIERDGEIVARWPIVFDGKTIRMPKYTQTIGVYLNPKYIQTTADEEAAYLNLIDQLPSGVHADWILAPENKYFLPFVWNNFKVSVGASYVINDLSDTDAVFARMAKNIQRDILQAEKKVIVQQSEDIEQLIALSLATYRRQRREYIVKPEIIRNIFQACKAHNACSLLAAKDANDNIHSMALFVYDEAKCYYLVGASEPELNAKTCANTLLIWEGIKIAAKHSKKFDFEGSMIKGIGTFFRRFGAELEPHYTITRKGLFGDLALTIKPWIKHILGHKK